MLNLEKVTGDNCYDLLPQYVDTVLEDCNVDRHHFLDVCLAICASDENIGTNRLELDIDKFFVCKDSIWSSIIGTNIEISSTISELPKIQKMRVVSDTLVILLRENGKHIDTNYNSEASKNVATAIGVSEGIGTFNDRSIDGIVDSLNEIRSLYVIDIVDKSDNKEVASERFIRLLEYVTSVDKALNRVLSEEFLNNIGNIKVLESILYRDTYGDLVFSEEFLENNNLSKDCVEFIYHNFSVRDESISVSNLEIAFNKYLSYWKTSLVYITHLVIKFYYKVSPVYTTTCLKNLQDNRIFPIGIAVANQNSSITRDIQFDNVLLQKRFNTLCNNQDFTSESVIGLFLIISSVSSIKLISEQVLRGMLKDAELND